MLVRPLVLAVVSIVLLQASACASPASDGAGGGPGGAGGSPEVCPGVDLESDGDNCGACNHGCLGGACVEGICQAVQLAHIQDEVDLWGLTTDDQAAYVTNGSLASDHKGIYRLPFDGSPAERVLDYVDSAFLFQHEGSIFWTPLGVERFDIGTRTNTVLWAYDPVVHQAGYGDIVAYGDDVYYFEVGDSDRGPGGLYRLPRDGGVAPAVVISDIEYPTSLSLVGDRLFWRNGTVNGDTIEMLSLGDQTQTTVLAGLPDQAFQVHFTPVYVAADASRVYFVNVDLADNTYSVRTAPIGGGTVDTWYTTSRYLDALAIDDQYVYVAARSMPGDVEPQVLRFDKSTGKPEVIFTPPEDAVRLLTDGQSLLVSTWHDVFRLAR